QDLRSGEERRLAMILTRMQWSADEEAIAGETLDGHVAICPVSGARCSVLAAGLRPRWPAGGDRLYFLRAAERAGWFTVHSVKLDGSDLQRAGEIGPFRPFEVHFDVSREGRTVWAPFETGRRELWLADLR